MCSVLSTDDTRNYHIVGGKSMEGATIYDPSPLNITLAFIALTTSLKCRDHVAMKGKGCLIWGAVFRMTEGFYVSFQGQFQHRCA